MLTPIGWCLWFAPTTVYCGCLVDRADVIDANRGVLTTLRDATRNLREVSYSVKLVGCKQHRGVFSSCRKGNAPHLFTETDSTLYGFSQSASDSPRFIRFPAMLEEGEPTTMEHARERGGVR